MKSLFELNVDLHSQAVLSVAVQTRVPAQDASAWLAWIRTNQTVVPWKLLVGMFAVDGFIEAYFLAHFVDFHRREHIDDS
jgi:hypothetical protein